MPDHAQPHPDLGPYVLGFLAADDAEAFEDHLAACAGCRDEVGRLEANFTTMTRQLGSALAAERQRATGDARAAERARIAREVHDAISQHLFGLRMTAAAHFMFQRYTAFNRPVRIVPPRRSRG